WGSDKRRAEEALESYRKMQLFIQGLVDRSEVFDPKDPSLQMHKPETYGKFVRFVYDDELTFPVGREPYKDWKKRLNDQIAIGSRVYITGYKRSYSKDDDCENCRRPYQYRNADMPLAGIYEIVRTEKANYGTYRE